jgi:anti-sigma factor RsiW
MSCQLAAQIEAYHDRRLTAQARREVEAHLLECGQCGALLAELQSLSRTIQSAPIAPIPLETLARLRESLHAAAERSILHIAGWLTTAAAVILVGTLLVSPAARSDQRIASVPTSWQVEAVSPPPTELADGSMSSDVVPAQWMTDEFRMSDQAR